jgi:hypothetical protein
MAEMLIGV